jgi:hypothetical protein
MEFAEEFNFEAARNVADAAFLAETGEYLDRLEVDVLRGVFQGHKYPKIREETGQTYDYIKRTGKKIWDTLSAALGEKVTQTNVREALWRKWQASADTPTPKKSQNNQYLSVTNPEFPEFPEGVVGLDSDFYVERPPIESMCYATIEQPGCLIRIKAPKRMGKTLLSAKILDHAAGKGYQKVYLNLNQADFTNLDAFLRWFCLRVGQKLRLPNQLENFWDERFSTSTMNCTEYFEQYLLAEIHSPLALCLDEVDLLFPYPEIAEGISSFATKLA